MAACVKTVICICLCIACTSEESWDGVVKIDYRPQGADIQRIKRRIDLLHAGVTLRQDLAVARVRRTTMGYTLLSRRSEEGDRCFYRSE